jgi:hypothetical protein
MRNEIERHELIQRYLSGQMSHEEIRRFEELLAADSALAGELAGQQLVKTIVEEGSLLEIREKIKKIHGIADGNAGGGSQGNIPVYLLLFAFILIAGSILYFLNRGSEPPVTISGEFSPDNAISDHSTEPPGNENEEDASVNRSEANRSKPVKKKLKPDSEPDKPAMSGVTKNMTDATAENRSGNSTDTVYPEDLPPIAPVISEYEIPVMQEDISGEADTVDCSSFSISDGGVVTGESCDQQASGKISILPERIAGGSPPYSVSIDNANTFYSQLHFEDLLPRNYTVWVRDSRNCALHAGNFRIGTVDCGYEYVFAPGKDELWEIPSMGGRGIITIYNQQGVIVYRQEIEASANPSWNGNSMSGDPQPMGVYPFILSTGDGKSIVGNVTVVR